VFALVAERIDASLPSGPNWHQDLLRQKSDLVRRAILAQAEQFTLGDLAAQVPVASPTSGRD